MFRFSLSHPRSEERERIEMLPRADSVPWMEGEVDDAASWTRTPNNEAERKDDEIAIAGPVTSFKSILEGDWFVNSSMNPPHQDLPLLPNQQDTRSINGFCSNSNDNFQMQSVDLTSCPPSFALENLDPAHPQPFFLPKPCFSSIFNVGLNNPFGNGFDFGSEGGLLGQFHGNLSLNSSLLMGYSGFNTQSQMGTLELSSNSGFPAARLLPIAAENAAALGGGDFTPTGLEGSGNATFLPREKVLRPLEVFPPGGAQPTLFQKRKALRQNSGGADEMGTLEISTSRFDHNLTRFESMEMKRKLTEEGEIEEASVDASGLNYDSDELFENGKVEENLNDGGSNSVANSTVTGGGQKGKKKGLPAKNLMAERRRRKKLNDRLYMLRSVVPKISKV